MNNLRCKLWAWPWELRHAGILGINARNRNVIARCNPRFSYPSVDDKAITKQICKAHGIPVPQTYAVIERLGDLRRLPQLLDSWQTFVVKPARGTGGRGILVLERRHGGTLKTVEGKTISQEDLRYHMSAILSGLYSLGGHLDRVIVEQRIVPHPVFNNLTVDGTPDVRIIVYSGVPVMAMLRLPTRESKGRANLHQGAVAAGVDLVTGRTFGGVYRNHETRIHPDTGQPLEGIAVPHWKKVLNMITNVGKALQMGYVGVDVVIDAELGPVVIEANARPGLAIQMANRLGLKDRFKDLDRQAEAKASPYSLLDRTPVHVLTDGAGLTMSAGRQRGHPQKSTSGDDVPVEAVSAE